MQATSAIELINAVVYRPGWKITASDLTDRFEDTINLRINYPARLTDRDQAEAGYPIDLTPRANFPLIVRDCDEIELLRKVLQAILEVEAHEAREFLRVRPTFWAPFHPHRVDGMHRWGNAAADLRFGLA